MSKTELRGSGFPVVQSDSRVEIVKVKLRTRNRKGPVGPAVTNQSKEESDPLTSEIIAASRVLTPSQIKTPDSESQDQFDFEADYNGNLLKEKNNRSLSSVRESFSFPERPGMSTSSSTPSLVRPSNIPVERFPQEENFIDIAVAEVITPSKLYVNMGKSQGNHS